MLRRWLMATAAAGLVLCTGLLRAQEVPRPIDPQQAVLNDLAHLGRQLADVGLTQAQREEAARRLAVRGQPEGKRILLDVLTDERNSDGQLAVVRALAAHPSGDPDFIVPLFALMGPNRQRTEAAGQALAAYRSNSTVFARLNDLARSRQAEAVVRSTAIRTLGSFADRRSAAALVQLLQVPDENPAIVVAVCDALSEMTALRENGRDPQAWIAWWREAQTRGDPEFKADLLDARAARHDQLRHEHTQLVQGVQALLREQYLAAPEAGRPDMVLRYLRAAEPEIRLVGARILQQEASVLRAGISPAAQERLREMAGDSSPAVRLEVVRALHAINDPEALVPLLAQLHQEREEEIRVAIASALAPIRDLRAVPTLLSLLSDPSPRVAEAAALALRDLGGVMREQAPALAGQTAEALRQVIERTAAPGASLPLRRAAVEAMVPLRDANLFRTFDGLTRQGEIALVRRSAVLGLGELRQARFSDAIVRALDDPNDDVRLEAVTALGKVPVADHAEALYRRLEERNEPSAAVRARVWQVLEGLLPHLPDHQLSNWADRLQSQSERRHVVLLALAKKLADTDQQESLAVVRQNIAETLMQLDRPAEAANYLKLALDYWKQRPLHARQIHTERLIRDRIVALLRSGEYAEAIQFAGESIEADASHQQTMGVEIRREAERLRDNREYDNATRLIELAMNMAPSLSERYRDDLSRIARDIQERRQQLELEPNRGGNMRSVTRPGIRVDDHFMTVRWV